MQHGSLAYYDSNIFYISPVSIHKRSIEVVHDSELLFFIVLITLSSVIHFLYRKGGITMQYSTSFKQQFYPNAETEYLFPLLPSRTTYHGVPSIAGFQKRALLRQRKESTHLAISKHWKEKSKNKQKSLPS